MKRSAFPTSTLTRRRFLERLGIGGAAAAAILPLVPILNASGQEMTTAPKRLILWSGSDGMETNWNGLASPLLSLLKSNDIVSVYGIKHNYGGGGEGHMQGATALWTASRVSPGNLFQDPTGPSTGGWGEGPSIDQIIAKSIPSYSTTPFQSVSLGVGSGAPHTRSRVIYSAANQPIHPETSALNAFTRLFGTGAVTNPIPGGAAANEALIAAQIQRASIDVLQKQLTRLTPRIAAEERYKLQAHQDGLAAILRRIDNSYANLSCNQGTAARYYDTSGVTETDQVIAAVDLMTDIIVAALACDRTRIISMQLLHTLYLGALFGHGEVHAACHGRRSGNIDVFYINTMAKLIERLKAIPEGNGTLFDNTLIVHGRDLGDGNHSKMNIPYILAGRAGGALKTGRAVTVDAEQAAMLVTIGRLMGMDTLNSVGNIRPNTGPIAQVLA